MGGTGNGQELTEALDYAKKNGFKVTHRFLYLDTIWGFVTHHNFVDPGPSAFYFSGMSFSLAELLKSQSGKQLELHHKYLNPQFAKVLKTIGFDVNFVRAKGVSLFADNGDEYLDFLSGYGVYALGRNHPELKKQLVELVNADAPNLLQMEAPLLSGLLAEKLVQMFGHGKRNKVFFTNSGTEAVEGALKFARAATGRRKFLHLDHAFHGLSTGSLSVNGNEEFRKKFGPFLESESILVGDLKELEAKLKTKEYAAFVFEPIQGKGVFPLGKEFLQKATSLCGETGTLLVADEIQAGLGRTGKWLASDHYGIEPDIVTLAKALSGGFVPAGAIQYTDAIYEKVFSRMEECVVHSSTFGQNTLAMGCGLAALHLMEEENVVENAAQVGKILKDGLLELQNKHDWIKEVRGEGLMIGIEFHKPQSLKKKIVWDTVHKMDPGLFGELIVMRLFSEHKILTQVSGHHQDIVKLIPPLTLTEEQAQKFLQAFDETLQDCDKVTGPILKMAANLAKHALKKA